MKTDREMQIELIKKEKEALGISLRKIAEQLVPVVDNIINTIKSLYDAMIKGYPNPRVVHNALYHPRVRIRKKNIKRIMRWIKNGA